MVGLVVLGLFMGEQSTPPPAPAPVPAPTPAVAPAPAAALPNLSGVWHSRSGESYAFTQQGTNLAFSILAAGNPVGQGAGSVEAGTVALAMNLFFGGQQMTMACELQLSPDQRAMTGACRNSLNGQITPAQIFR